jgi:hypothetical protein
MLKTDLTKAPILRFGHLKLGPRPKGGESGGPILEI